MYDNLILPDRQWVVISWSKPKRNNGNELIKTNSIFFHRTTKVTPDCGSFFVNANAELSVNYLMYKRDFKGTPINRNITSKMDYYEHSFP